MTYTRERFSVSRAPSPGLVPMLDCVAMVAKALPATAPGIDSSSPPAGHHLTETSALAEQLQAVLARAIDMSPEERADAKGWASWVNQAKVALDAATTLSPRRFEGSPMPRPSSFARGIEAVRPLGSAQAWVLRHLCDFGFPDGGWIWSVANSTIRVLESLRARGYAEHVGDGYRITRAGRARMALFIDPSRKKPLEARLPLGEGCPSTLLARSLVVLNH